MFRSFPGVGFILQKKTQNNKMKNPQGLDGDIFGKATEKRHSQGVSLRS